MSADTSAFGFGQFIPGFDFLQGLAQSAAGKPMGAAAAAAPQWVAPTVSVEEVEKRIAELKAVQFWLEQNSRAVAATIQALEVQRMTLSTLKDMNVSLSDLAQNFAFAAAPAASQAAASAQKASSAADTVSAQAAASSHRGWPMGSGQSKAERQSAAAQAAQGQEPRAPQAEAQAEAQAEVQAGAQPAPEPAKEQASPAGAQAQDAAQDAGQDASAQNSGAASGQAALGQAMQWWGALTQQFQQIATKVMTDPVPAETLAAAQRATEMASGFAKSTLDKVMAKAAPVSAAFGTAASASAAKAAKAAPASRAPQKPVKAAAKKAPAAKSAKPAQAVKTARSQGAAAAAKPAAKKPAAKNAAPKTTTKAVTTKTAAKTPAVRKRSAAPRQA